MSDVLDKLKQKHKVKTKPTPPDLLETYVYLAERQLEECKAATKVNPEIIKTMAGNEGERIIADRIEMHIIDNYPKFYNKEIFTKTDKSIVKEFLSIYDSDEKLKALIKSKEPVMWWKKYILEDFYTKYRDSLIIELEKELKDN